MKASEEKLVEQIKSVFEDFDDGLGEQGWTELRKQYPEKDYKKLPIWWLTGIAATLLVAMGLYFSTGFDTEKTVSTAVKTQNKKVLPETNTLDSEVSRAVTKLDTHKNDHRFVDQKTGTGIDSAQNEVKNTTQYIVQNNVAIDTKPPTEVNVVVSNSTVPQTNPMTVVAGDNSAVAATKTDDKVIANTGVTDGSRATEKPIKQKLSTEDFLKEESKLMANSVNQVTKKSGVSKTTLDVFTGTFFNYHDDNEAKLSAGVGLNANVKVTKNLVFSFGAGISQNKVSYENKVPTELSQAMFESKSADVASAAPLNGFAYSATATNDLSFNGKLLSIDLPMVVKFFPSKKQDFYISTGINSSTYLTQKYTYNYSLSNFGYRNGEAQQQTQTEESNLKGFDFANSAIIAIGINQSIGKNILIFEPYYKPALNTMGDKNLRISSAGLNLKFNFNGNNKK